jgi:hypothetical protein
MNNTAAHLAVVPDPDPADEMVALIDAHVAAATKPRLVREPVRTRQERFDTEGLPRTLMPFSHM